MNKKHTLIIADDSADIRKNLRTVFEQNDFEVVAEESDGQSLLNRIIELKPDAVIMDLVLQSIDGFAILEQLHKAGVETNIVIHTSLSQDGFINKAIAQGAKYYVIKPFDETVLCERMKSLLQPVSKTNRIYTSDDLMPTHVRPRANIIEERISNIFISVGIPAHIKGYQFLREAVKLAIETPDIVNNITKKLYPSIADKFDTSSSKVERAIRHAIEVAWSRGKIENINILFGIKVYTETEKPTNGEFIALVADKMLIEGA